MKTLKLSDDQAEILYQILFNVGGDPFGPRGQVDEILRMLRRAKVNNYRKDIIVYDGAVPPDSIHRFKPALYIEDKKEYYKNFPVEED